MFYFYLSIILGIALLYSHRKRFLSLARSWREKNDIEEGTESREFIKSVDDAELTQELERANETLSKLPGLIVDSFRGHFEQEQQLRVQILSNQDEMSTRLETFNLMATILHRSTVLLEQLEKQIKQPVGSESSQASALTRSPDHEAEVSWVQAEKAVGAESPAATWSSTTELERFVNQNIEQINRAGYEGLPGIRTFLQNSESAIALHSPADGIVVLVEREGSLNSEGRAFVLPGQLLGRPWVDWFDVSKELIRPVEATIYPAVVFGKGDGKWELRKRGQVSQQ